MVIKESSPFGSRSRTRVLLALRLLSESYPRELARLLAQPLAGVQRALESLERDGLVGARTIGRMRVYRLEPRYFGYRELQQFLLRLTEPDADLRARVASLRRRPRRSGKPL
jgi:DNA-binding transcriptional ArsR family regulator